MCTNKITPRIEYQLEVYKNRNNDLKLHSKVLEKKVEFYKEQQNMFKVMMSDLEAYKQKAEMSKELATYFSPFSPINQFSQESLFKQQQTKNNIIDVKLGMADKTSETIKDLSQQVSKMKEIESQNKQLVKDIDKFKEKHRKE